MSLKKAKMKRMSSWTPATGTYALYVYLPVASTLMIGRLGKQRFAAGTYSYVGSAFGAGGLQARLARHMRADKRPHWHIDALLRVAVVRAVCYVESAQRYECRWGQGLLTLPQAHVPVPHFGASDCRHGCAAHLIGFERDVSIAAWHKILTQLTLGTVTLMRL